MEDIRLMSNTQLQKRLAELEDSFAQALSDNCDANTLTLLWKRIQLYRNELENRMQGN